MTPLRRRINPQTFVISLRQIAKHLNINPKRILNWDKWAHVLWVHIEGRGGYFVSYRQLEQWIAACSTIISFCRDVKTLHKVWVAIQLEAKRYTEEALERLREIWQQRKVGVKSQLGFAQLPPNFSRGRYSYLANTLT